MFFLTVHVNEFFDNLFVPKSSTSKILSAIVKEESIDSASVTG